MKKYLLVSFALALFPLFGKAQSQVHYTYDNAGNRLTQSVIYDEPDRSKNGQGNRGYDIKSRELSGHTVSVLSNAEMGQVQIEVLGLEDGDDCQLAFYSLAGTLLISEQATSTRTMFDLSPYPTGIYILVVRLNGESASWKIIKK